MALLFLESQYVHTRQAALHLDPLLFIPNILSRDLIISLYIMVQTTLETTDVPSLWSRTDPSPSDRVCPEESLRIEDPKEDPLTPTSCSRPSVKTKILLTFFTLMIICITTLPVKRCLLQSVDWIADQGFTGQLLFIAIFWCGVVLGFPSTIFEALAGFIFGFGPSLVITTVGKNGGSVLVFGLGQVLGKDTIGRYLKQTFPTFQALGSVIEEGDWKLICLLQAAYLPIFVKCFLLSICNVDFSLFLITSCSCGIPYTFFWSYFGSSSHHILDVLEGKSKRGFSKTKYAFLSLGLIAGLGAMIVLGRFTKKQLARLKASGLPPLTSDGEGMSAGRSADVNADRGDIVLTLSETGG